MIFDSYFQWISSNPLLFPLTLIELNYLTPRASLRKMSPMNVIWWAISKLFRWRIWNQESYNKIFRECIYLKKIPKKSLEKNLNDVELERLLGQLGGRGVAGQLMGQGFKKPFKTNLIYIYWIWILKI